MYTARAFLKPRLVQLLRRLYSNTLAGITVTDSGRNLLIPSGGGNDGNYTYHALWLRHNCQCPMCLSNSNQKTVTGHQLKGDLRIKHASVNDGKVIIDWKSDCDDKLSHTGSLCLQWVKDNNYSNIALKKKSTEMKPITGAKIPFVDYHSVMESDEGLWKWLYNLNTIGYSIVSGMPSYEDEIKKVCGRISNIQRTIYGEFFDVRSEPNPTNIAYTTLHLDFHMDLAYYQSPPGLQALHCLRYDECVEGGESILLDSLAVVNKMRTEYPKQFEALTEIPATFQKIHFDREYPVVMVYRRPHIVLDRYGHVTKVNWSPPFEGPLTVPEGDVDRYYEAYILLNDLLTYSELKITHQLREGEMIVFNNQRILHGRQKFELNGGKRLLKGCYINIDEFASKFSVLSNQLNKNIAPKHVLNESSYLL